jgi:hypothetical protein
MDLYRRVDRAIGLSTSVGSQPKLRELAAADISLPAAKGRDMPSTAS